MTIFGGPYTTGNMDQPQWEEAESKLWTNGVVKGARNEFVTTTTTGLGISVNTGNAMLDGFRFYADATTPLTAAAADPSLPRIDLLVLRLDETAHTATIALKTGTPAASPSAPSATQTPGGTYELGIYQVRVNAGSSTITSLTDVRTYTAPAGAVATATYTAADVLTKIKTVDGSGSGLDADLLDGLSSAAFAQLTGATFSGGVTAPSVTTTPPTVGVTPVYAVTPVSGTNFAIRYNANTIEIADTTNGHTLMIFYSAGVGTVGIGMNDDGTLRQAQIFTGTTDPAGRAGVSVREGDIWIKG